MAQGLSKKGAPLAGLIDLRRLRSARRSHLRVAKRLRVCRMVAASVRRAAVSRASLAPCAGCAQQSGAVLFAEAGRCCCRRFFNKSAGLLVAQLPAYWPRCWPAGQQRNRRHVGGLNRRAPPLN